LVKRFAFFVMISFRFSRYDGLSTVYLQASRGDSWPPLRLILVSDMPGMEPRQQAASFLTFNLFYNLFIYTGQVGWTHPLVVQFRFYRGFPTPRKLNGKGFPMG